MKRALHIILVIFICIISTPFLLLAGYLGYSIFMDAYATHILTNAAPDAVKYDQQSYETDNGSYDAHFYKFTKYNDDYTQDWETKTSSYPDSDYEFKVKKVHSGPFTCVIIVNPTAQCATIEYHSSLFE